MHTSRLRETVEFLLRKNLLHNIDQYLSEIEGQMNNLASSPQNSSFQLELSAALKRLSDAFYSMQEEFEPSQIKATNEINGHDYFLSDTPSAFSTIINDNPLTPAVARDRINHIISNRRAYINTLTQLNEKLEAVGVEPLELAEDEAEIGFQIPRSMFSNQLDLMTKELNKINRILRAFSELETGSIEPVKIKTISTSDPLFFFGISTPVIIAVGEAVKWGLNLWKEVEEIRLARAQTQKIKSIPEEETQTFFDRRITESIETAISRKLDELLSTKQRGGREHEQRQDLNFALDYIMAAIERGLTVEIRYLPAKGSFTDSPQEDGGSTGLTQVDTSGNWRRIEFCDSLTGVDLAEKDRCRGRTAFGMSRID